jgi:hypothetical protein
MNHEKLTESVRRNPVRTAAVLAVLTVLIVVLIVKTKVYKARLDECRGKNGFLTPGIGNFEIPGMNPIWWRGSMATGGLFERDPVTPQQMAAYEPRFRRDVQRRMARQRQWNALKQALGRKKKKEKMHNPPCSRAEFQSVDDEGNAICLEPGEAWTSGCVAGWDPAAVAETEGLSAAGGLDDTDSPGEDRIRSAVNAVYDTEDGQTEAQIAEMYEYNSFGV